MGPSGSPWAQAIELTRNSDQSHARATTRLSGSAGSSIGTPQHGARASGARSYWPGGGRSSGPVPRSCRIPPSRSPPDRHLRGKFFLAFSRARHIRDDSRAAFRSGRRDGSSGPCTVSGSSTRRPLRCGLRFWTREPTSARFARCIGFWRSTARSESAGTNGAIRTTPSRSCWPKRRTRFGRGISRSFVAPSSGPTTTSTSSSTSSSRYVVGWMLAHRESSGRRSLWSSRTAHHRSAPDPSRSSTGSSRTLRSRNAATARFASAGLDQLAAGKNDPPRCRRSPSRGGVHTWGTPFFCFTQRDLDRC